MLFCEKVVVAGIDVDGKTHDATGATLTIDAAAAKNSVVVAAALLILTSILLLVDDVNDDNIQTIVESKF